MTLLWPTAARLRQDAVSRMWLLVCAVAAQLRRFPASTFVLDEGTIHLPGGLYDAQFRLDLEALLYQEVNRQALAKSLADSRALTAGSCAGDAERHHDVL